MCKEEAYHYIKLITKAEEDIRKKIEEVLSQCPEKILQRIPQIRETKRIFRFARVNNENKDKYPYFLSNPKLFRKRAKDKYSTCIMCGLSVFLAKESMERKIKEKFRKGKFFILEAYFKPEYGSLYKTSTDNSGHCTFFPCENFEHDKFFKKIGVINITNISNP